MSRDIDVKDHYLAGEIPAEISANFKEYFPDHEDLSLEEFLSHQGCVYLSYQENGKQLSSGSRLSGGQEGESSRYSQEALDEALARSLQELEEDFDDVGITEHSSTTGITENSVEAPPRATSENSRQDDVDPDNMNYEELITLAERVGVEKKGLSEEVIARLPTFKTNFKNKTGIFSRKKKKQEDCVICQMEYKNGDKLTSLPCAHQYHSKCIKEWLIVSKECPVCKMEVKVEA